MQKVDISKAQFIVGKNRTVLKACQVEDLELSFGEPMSDEEWRIVAEATAPRGATSFALSDGKVRPLR